MRIELTRAILIPRFSNFPNNTNINFRMCVYLVTCFLTVAVSLLCRSKGRKISSPFCNYQTGINNVTCIFDTACNRHSNETVTLRKHVTKHSNLRKLMVLVPENVRILALKSLDLTLFLSPILSIYFNFVRCWGAL